VTHVIKQNDILFLFKSPLNPNNKEAGDLLAQHGDHVKDIAFSVTDLDYLVEKAKEAGANVVRDIWVEKDEHGFVRMATIQTYGDVTHTLIERANYNGNFLPGFKPHFFQDPLNDKL
jgi:4-hydroxyphenylpyruvate dioxygenase